MSATFDNVQKLFPSPEISPIYPDNLEDSGFKRLWDYFTKRTMFVYTEDWFFTLPNGIKAMIPAGHRTDFASIPFFLRPLMTSTGPLLRGAGVHDFGYERNYLNDWEGNKIFVGQTRKFWDDLFRDAVIFTSRLHSLAHTAWAGVRTFGWIPWGKYRRTK